MPKVMTVCIVRRGNEILLGQQKDTPTKIWKKGVGLWNGFGGKVEPDDLSIEVAAQREVKEETKIVVPKLRLAGVMTYSFTDGECNEVHFFAADEYVGDPQETDEMVPRWFSIDEIPYDRMWPDTPQWMPFFLANHKFRGRVLYDNNKEVLEWEVEHA